MHDIQMYLHLAFKVSRGQPHASFKLIYFDFSVCISVYSSTACVRILTWILNTV